MVSRKVSRRRFVATTAVASTALVAAPFVRGAYAAGKLSLGLWDHWVPGANKTSEALIKEWADKEKSLGIRANADLPGRLVGAHVEKGRRPEIRVGHLEARLDRLS